MALPFFRRLSGRNAWIAIIVLIAAFLFYWFQVRPIVIYRSCTTQASIDARQLLLTKSQIVTDARKAASYQTLIDKNMYLRSDYESFLRKCLLYYGLPPVSLEGDEEAVSDEMVEE